MADKFQNKYRIPSARHPNWDYGTNGAYFITICTKDRQYFFGESENGKMKLSTVGAIAQGFWYEIPKHFPFIELGEFVVMPNHIHGVLILNKNKFDENIIDAINHVETLHCNVSTENKNDFYKKKSPKSGSISTIVRSYKSICTKHIHSAFPTLNFEWQTRFWDNIIRENEAFNTISQYIMRIRG